MRLAHNTVETWEDVTVQRERGGKKQLFVACSIIDSRAVTLLSMVLLSEETLSGGKGDVDLASWTMVG